jgi:ribosomal protein S27AE
MVKMPSRTGLLIAVLALCAGFFALFMGRIFGAEYGFVKVWGRIWDRKKRAFYKAKERQLDEELAVKEHKEICPRCGEFKVMSDQLPPTAGGVYSRLCLSCAAFYWGAVKRK